MRNKPGKWLALRFLLMWPDHVVLSPTLLLFSGEIVDSLLLERLGMAGWSACVCARVSVPRVSWLMELVSGASAAYA